MNKDQVVWISRYPEGWSSIRKIDRCTVVKASDTRVTVRRKDGGEEIYTKRKNGTWLIQGATWNEDSTGPSPDFIWIHIHANAMRSISTQFKAMINHGAELSDIREFVRMALVELEIEMSPVGQVVGAQS